MSVAPTMPGSSPIGWRSLLVTGALLAGAAVLLVGLFAASTSEERNSLAFDFRSAYLPAAEIVSDGRSPYPDVPSAPESGELTTFSYPPTLAVLLTPATVIGKDGAAIGAVLVSLSALLAALAVVGVRDLRCFAVVVLWAPGWNALEMANLSALLALGAALVWRFRSRAVPLGATLVALVSVKLFLWPLLVWAGATRRAVAASTAALVSLLVILASWALIGFAGLTTYPDLAAVIARQSSYSLEDLAQVVGLGVGAGRALSLAAGGALLGLCVVLGRRGDEDRAFYVAIGAALALSPIVWLHYLVLLAVPLGIARPRFSVLWLVPIVLWVCPRFGNGEGWETLVPAAAVAIVLGSLIVRPREPAPVVAT